MRGCSPSVGVGGPLEVKLLSTLLYHCGFSYRVAAYALRGESSLSHESVRLWPRRLGEAFQEA
ncbi:MAG: hypothetical protein QW057_03320 [Candidatus Bathyarchaeia archaeon]